MPNFEFRFDLAAILLASVLTTLGISVADAGGKSGDQGGNMSSRGTSSHTSVGPASDGSKPIVLAGGAAGGTGDVKKPIRLGTQQLPPVRL